MKCKCGNEMLVKAGFRITRLGRQQRYLCKQCGRTMVFNNIGGKENNGTG